jgi:response regulator RpfG family c-di-GMP phosphodiesterase
VRTVRATASVPTEAAVDILQALDYAALERTEGGEFYLRTAPARWFEAIFRQVDMAAPVGVVGRSHYLDHFLEDACRLWLGPGQGQVRSDTWIEVDSDGISWPLEALAITRDGASYLVIQHLGERYAEQFHILQAAREHLLREERLETEVRARTASIRLREEEVAMRLLSAAATRDGETGGHVRRIGLYAAVLGEALGWDRTSCENIRIAAPMHDIGKIGIPDAILRKPGRLTSDEFRIMQQHTVIGARMLEGSDIPLLKVAAEVALCHHEKWNGSGYPNGLKGIEIPISARIVTIVDVYDAMISRRVYKPAIPEQEVIASMRAASGVDFDPEIFEVFTGVIDTMRDIREKFAD